MSLGNTMLADNGGMGKEGKCGTRERESKSKSTRPAKEAASNASDMVVWSVSEGNILIYCPFEFWCSR